MRQPAVTRVILFAFFVAAMGAAPAGDGSRAANTSRAKLRTEEFTADSTAFNVNATLLIGPTESILFDAQYLTKDAARIADRIAATGTHLKAIVLTHPDDDHYFGVATILERFPGTPVYISPTGLDEFNARELPHFSAMKARIAVMMKAQPGRTPPPVPDSLIVPQSFPSSHLTVDGEDVRIFSDVQGDVLKPANSYFWIPSIRTVITGDIVFNGVHVWLAASNEASRAAWQKSLQQIAALKPAVVIAGHKSRADAPDTDKAIAVTSAYLTDFDAAVKTSAAPEGVVAIMIQKYPALVNQPILAYAAQHAFGK